MKKFIDFVERHLVPIAGKLASQKHLVAIRDAFMCTMPVMLSGAVCVMLVNVFFAQNSLLSQWIAAPEFFAWTGLHLAPIFQKIVNGSVAITSLVFGIGLAYHRATQEKQDVVSNIVICLAALIVMGFNSFFNPQGVFVTMIMTLIISEINFWVVKKNWTIKMPDTVPPAVSKAFSAVIPGLFCLVFAALVDFGFSLMTISDAPATIFTWFRGTIQVSLNKMGSSFIAVLILTALVPFFWFFGIHGGNMLAPILDTVYVPFLNENMLLYLDGARTIEDGLHVWTRLSFDVFGKMGGGGSTICLLIAIFLVGKLSNERFISKMALAPGIFNINEPVTFGIPTVLNVFYVIPLILVPTLQVAVAYLLTSAGIIAPVVNNVPWVIPPILGAFLATNGDIPATLCAVFNLVMGVIIYIPFVIVSNRIKKEN